MKKIFVEMGGRCGNQMFQYAFARALQTKYYPEHRLALLFRNVEKCGAKEDGWENSLQYFNIAESEITNKIKLSPIQCIRCWHIIRR